MCRSSHGSSERRKAISLLALAIQRSLLGGMGARHLLAVDQLQGDLPAGGEAVGAPDHAVGRAGHGLAQAVAARFQCDDCARFQRAPPDCSRNGGCRQGGLAGGRGNELWHRKMWDACGVQRAAVRLGQVRRT